MTIEKIKEGLKDIPKITYSALEEKGLNTFEVFHWLMHNDRINISEVCRFLGISRRTLYYRINKDTPLFGIRAQHPPVHVFKKTDDYIKFLKYRDQQIQRELLRTSEAAAYLGVTPQYICRLKKKGEIFTTGKRIVKGSLDMFRLKKCAI